MLRRLLLSAVVATMSFSMVSTILQAAESNSRNQQRPNIVILLADDQGWGDLSLHGNTNLSTPNIDSLAHDGAQFERFFVCPVCAPTRAEFLTGRYYGRTGVISVSRGEERMNPDEYTIAQNFKQAGYATGAFGKWHNGSQHPYHPNSRGFDEYFGFTSGHWGHYFDPVLEHNGEILRGSGYITDILTDHALDFISTNAKAEQPFFCYVPFNTPHSPMQVPDKYFDKFANRKLEKRHRDPEKENSPHLRAALAMCENIDWNVGRVLKKLDELKIADNTIVLYFSDNGPNGFRWNGDMKGKKASVDEGGVRVPCLVRWPGRIPAGTKIKPIAGAIDLLPTFAELASIPLKSTKPLDGKSLKPLLLGTETTQPDRELITIFPLNRRRGKNRLRSISVRNQQYRLDPAGQLFDMQADPGQRVDISAQHPKVTAQLKNAAATHLEQLGDIPQQDDRPFPIGGATLTHLPARDGKEHGGVQRSNRAPNCSYFLNWTNTTDDKITWPVEVLSAGTYEVQIYYTCPAADVGSTFELTLNDSRLEGQVAKANDPPERGSESDRADRGSESFVKNFKPMTVGNFNLKKGQGELTLRALNIPGKQVMDVRLLMFIKR